MSINTPKQIVVDMMRCVLAPIDDGWISIARHRHLMPHEDIKISFDRASLVGQLVCWYDIDLTDELIIDMDTVATAITIQHSNTAITLCCSYKQLKETYARSYFVTSHKFYTLSLKLIPSVVFGKSKYHYVNEIMEVLEQYDFILVCVTYSNPHILFKNRKRIYKSNEVASNTQALERCMTSKDRDEWIASAISKNLAMCVLRIVSPRDDASYLIGEDIKIKDKMSLIWEHEIRVPTFYM